MTDNDICALRSDMGDFAQLLFGTAAADMRIAHSDRLCQDGTYAKLSRKAFLDGASVASTDLRGMLFYNATEAAAENELVYEGSCFEFFIDGQRPMHLEVHHSIGQLTISSFGEVTYDPQELIGYCPPGDDTELPQLIDMLSIQELKSLLIK